MADPIRLVMIAPYPLLPAVAGGKIRIHQLARHLTARGVDVTVLSPYKPFNGKECRDHGKLLHIYYPFLLHHWLTDRPLPYQFLISVHPGYARLVQRHLKHADIVQFEHCSFADVLPAVPPTAVVVYDAHNVEYEYVTSECRQPWLRELVGRRVFEMESALVRRADHVLTCSQEDSVRLASLYGAADRKFSVIPNGIDAVEIDGHRDPASSARWPGLAAYRQRALFAGSDVEHNRQAVRYLVERLAPELGERAAILIKGGCAQSLGRALPRNVFADPMGGEIRTIAASCNVAVHPVMQGSGTSLKLLDYLSHGLPVISTEFGMRGYADLRPFVEIQPLEGFAGAVLAAPKLPAGWKQALEPYLWSVGAERMETIYRNLLAPRRSAPS